MRIVLLPVRHSEGEKRKDRKSPRPFRWLLLVAALVARLAKELAVLLLRHTLAALLNYGTHSDLTNKLDTDRRGLPSPHTADDSTPCAGSFSQVQLPSPL